jgi:hypothetical protein
VAYIGPVFIVEPGREYLLAHVAGDDTTPIVFGGAEGTTDEELLRALIHRVKFRHLVGDDGAEDDEDPVALANLRGALLALEVTKARRRGVTQMGALLAMIEERHHRIEDEPPCGACGFLRCVEHPAPAAP